MIENEKSISKNIFPFSILIIELKNVKRKKKFWIYLDSEPLSKNENQNFWILFLIWNQKMNSKKLFHFAMLVMKLENEKWKILKIHLALISKNELYFRYTDSVGWKGQLIFILKWNRILNLFCFSFSLSNGRTKFKFQFQFSIKIEKIFFIRFFTRYFLCLSTYLPLFLLKLFSRKKSRISSTCILSIVLVWMNQTKHLTISFSIQNPFLRSLQQLIEKKA